MLEMGISAVIIMDEKKRDLEQEGLEIYLLHYLLAAGEWLFLSGVLFSLFSIALMRVSIIAGSIAACAAVILLLSAVSYPFAAWMARASARIGTRFRMKR